MLENTTTNLDSLSKEGSVSDVALASSYIRDAFPTSRYGNAKASCWHAFRKLKLASERRARAIWNSEARRIDAHEMDALRVAALEEYRREKQRAQDRIAALEAALIHQDPDFHEPSIQALGAMDGARRR